jgi:hypothetical protein
MESRSIGTALMAISGLQMLIFTIGVMRRSYAAIAIPVLGAMAVISGLLFWVGYTLTSMEPDTALDIDLEDEAALGTDAFGADTFDEAALSAGA